MQLLHPLCGRGDRQRTNRQTDGYFSCVKPMIKWQGLTKSRHTKSIHIWQVDFITEQHKPLVQLQRRQNEAVWSLAIFAVMIESLQHQLWCSSTGKVQSDNLPYAVTDNGHCQQDSNAQHYNPEVNGLMMSAKPYLQPNYSSCTVTNAVTTHKH